MSRRCTAATSQRWSKPTTPRDPWWSTCAYRNSRLEVSERQRESVLYIWECVSQWLHNVDEKSILIKKAVRCWERPRGRHLYARCVCVGPSSQYSTGGINLGVGVLQCFPHGMWVVSGGPPLTGFHWLRFKSRVKIIHLINKDAWTEAIELDRSRRAIHPTSLTLSLLSFTASTSLWLQLVLCLLNTYFCISIGAICKCLGENVQKLTKMILRM